MFLGEDGKVMESEATLAGFIFLGEKKWGLFCAILI
jgi:hypothetical protein